jgi:hypothetical protein
MTPTADPLGRWRGSARRSLVVIGDSIANQFTKPLRATLRDRLPGGVSFGYAGLAGRVFAGWKAAGNWVAVGTTASNLGLPATPNAARRSRGGDLDVLTWTCPSSWVADEAELHWVDDAESGAAFSYRVDDGPWTEVACAGPDRPTFRRTPLGPIGSHVLLRAARIDGAATPSPVFIGLDARDRRAANVVHSLTFPGGPIATRPGADLDACLRPDRLDVAIQHLALFEPTLILWETINDAKHLDLVRLDGAIGAVERAFPGAEHVAACVYATSDRSPHAPGQDALHRFMSGRFAAVVDFRSRWGSPPEAVAAGLLDADGVHPTRVRGAADLAAAVSELLTIEPGEER